MTQPKITMYSLIRINSFNIRTDSFTLSDSEGHICDRKEHQ